MYIYMISGLKDINKFDLCTSINLKLVKAKHLFSDLNKARTYFN